MPYDLGFRGVGSEFSTDPDIPDAVDVFVYSGSGLVNDADFSLHAGRELNKAMADFATVMEDITAILVYKIACELVGETATKLPEHSFAKWSQAQINYSRPKSTKSRFGHELHEDGHLVTFVNASGPGLEIKTPSDEFVAITPKPNEFLMMPGQVLSMLSGWYIPPLFHRVRKHEHNTSRTSVLYFADLEPELCHPWLQADGNSKDEIAQHVLTNSSRFGVADLPTGD